MKPTIWATIAGYVTGLASLAGLHPVYVVAVLPACVAVATVPHVYRWGNQPERTP